MEHLKGGYSIVDLTKYTFTANATTLTDEDVKKFVNAFNGKPLMLKYMLSGSYVCCQFVSVQSDNIETDVYIPIAFYDQNTILGNYSLNLSTKVLTYYKFE